MKQQWILMTGATCAVIATALFMIFESGEFYAGLYQVESNRGYWGAALIEILLAYSAAAYFLKKPVLNAVIKFGMVVLFLGAVAGASLKVVTPLWQDITTIKQKQKLEAFMLKENTQNVRSLEILEKQRQRTNTAVMIKESVAANKALKDELRQAPDQETWMVWATVILSVALRFALQFLNLVFSHVLGVLWREIFIAGKMDSKSTPKKVNGLKTEKRPTAKAKLVKKAAVLKTKPKMKATKPVAARKQAEKTSEQQSGRNPPSGKAPKVRLVNLKRNQDFGGTIMPKARKVATGGLS